MGTFNVTVDPLSQALPVNQPEIEEILNLETGEFLSAKDLIGSFRYDELIAERVRVRSALSTSPIYKCANCPSAVYIVSTPEKRFFFRHRHEDGSCPALTRTGQSQEDIKARKYHGLRESEPHKRIKRLLERSLLADAAFNKDSIQSEKRWHRPDDPKRWRQPDLQAIYGTQTVAFEAQLSTTFLDVVVGRRDDYREGGALLVWVMSGFDPNYRRLTTDDLLFSNNSNVFVVDDDTCRISEETCRFHLRCFYREPFVEGGVMKERWSERMVNFAELTRDLAGQRTYFFDFEGVERAMRNTIDATLRAAFLEYWTVNMTPYPEATTLKVWEAIRQKLRRRGIAVPERPDGNSSFACLVHAVLSAYQGKPVGWQFQKLVQVAHHVSQMHPEHILAFGYAVALAGHTALLAAQDSKGKWYARSERIKAKLVKLDPEFMPDRTWLEALSFLFPDVGERVRRFLRAADTKEAPASFSAAA